MSKRGQTLDRQGTLDEAEAIHRHATGLDGDPDEAFESLGFALRSQGRLEDAIEAFESARRLCSDADVSDVLAELETAIELRQGDKDESWATAKSAPSLRRESRSSRTASRLQIIAIVTSVEAGLKSRDVCRERGFGAATCHR